MEVNRKIIKSEVILVEYVMALAILLCVSAPALGQNTDTEVGQTNSVNSFEAYKQRSVERLRSYIEKRKLKASAATGGGSKELTDPDLLEKNLWGKPYIEGELYRVVVVVENDKGYPAQPRAFNAARPSSGGAKPADIQAFYAEHYQSLMREYFPESYLTFYKISILSMRNRKINFEVLIRDAREFDLLVSEERVRAVNSIVNKPVRETIEF